MECMFALHLQQHTSCWGPRLASQSMRSGSSGNTALSIAAMISETLAVTRLLLSFMFRLTEIAIGRVLLSLYEASTCAQRGVSGK